MSTRHSRGQTSDMTSIRGPPQSSSRYVLATPCEKYTKVQCNNFQIHPSDIPPNTELHATAPGFIDGHSDENGSRVTSTGANRQPPAQQETTSPVSIHDGVVHVIVHRSRLQRSLSTGTYLIAVPVFGREKPSEVVHAVVNESHIQLLGSTDYYAIPAYIFEQGKQSSADTGVVRSAKSEVPKKVPYVRLTVKHPCTNCRMARKRCSFSQPCDRCVERNLECVIDASVTEGRRKGRRGKKASAAVVKADMPIEKAISSDHVPLPGGAHSDNDRLGETGNANYSSAKHQLDPSSVAETSGAIQTPVTIGADDFVWSTYQSDLAGPDVSGSFSSWNTFAGTVMGAEEAPASFAGY